jgi:tetratricopeptide (TPR) repeat protein
MTPGLLFVATVPIVANRRTAGQLPGPAGLPKIRRILLPGYTEAKLQLANAYRKLRKQRDAIPLLEQLADSSTDKDAQDDALEILAWCQTEIESYDDAKNTWRTLLRRFPDSHFAPEAKLALQTLMQNH